MTLENLENRIEAMEQKFVHILNETKMIEVLLSQANVDLPSGIGRSLRNIVHHLSEPPSESTL